MKKAPPLPMNPLRDAADKAQDDDHHGVQPSQVDEDVTEESRHALRPSQYGEMRPASQA